MYPKKTFGAYGFHPEKTRFPVERMTTLGYLLSPLRRRTVLEKWSPIEIALFEASLTLFGKAFHRVQKYVRFYNELLFCVDHFMYHVSLFIMLFVYLCSFSLIR